MVGIFKRFAKIGGSAAPDHHDALTSIAKSYTALVAATNFLEVGLYAHCSKSRSNFATG